MLRLAYQASVRFAMKISSMVALLYAAKHNAVDISIVVVGEAMSGGREIRGVHTGRSFAILFKF